ncbi:MAG: DUF3459 domain-containing protein [Calditrichaeota bacterium]|nr:DUF3459 domain-containing protein [Calditrichota bacterium]
MRMDTRHLAWMALGSGLLGLSPFKLAPAWDAMPDSVVVTEQVPHLDWTRHAVIYEVNLRQYTEAGTLAAFREHLPRLKELGVDILWFMPLTPIGELNRKGGMGSYYSVKDYRAIDPASGSIEEFRALVKEIHGLGMHVIVDWVANHCAWDNHIASEHPEWITRDAQGNPMPPVPDWSDVIDLDYSQPGLREYMTGSLEWWLRETDIDGFRCDVAGLIPFDFWDDARPRLEAVKPVFMLAEWEDPRLHPRAFDMSYSWAFHNVMNSIARGERVPAAIDTVIQDFGKFPADAYLMHCVTNHDENSWNGTEFERMGEAVDPMTVLAWTVPGMPLIYSGQEIGLNRRLAFFEKDPIVWGPSPREAFHRRLNQLKHDLPVLANGSAGGVFQSLPVPDDRLYAFRRGSGSGALLAVFNFSDEARSVPAGHPALAGAALWAADGVEPRGDGIVLPAWGWALRLEN